MHQDRTPLSFTMISTTMVRSFLQKQLKNNECMAVML